MLAVGAKFDREGQSLDTAARYAKASHAPFAQSLDTPFAQSLAAPFAQSLDTPFAQKPRRAICQ
jgi:hypothetical protein